LPASQSTQSAELVEPVEPMYFPAMHATQPESSSTPLCLPAGQSSQLPPSGTCPDPTEQV
jgi:hypothetical protein